MVDGEILFGKVVSFYQSLPKELLEKSISDLALNREHRRKITKNKSILLKDKVRVLMNPKFREVFADSVYNTVKDSIPLDLNNSSYADIIEYMTDENKDYATIFFFRWCYEDGKDGSCNDDNYFEAFVNSELFDCIVKGESIADAKTLALNALKADPQPTEAQPTEAQPTEAQPIEARRLKRSRSKHSRPKRSRPKHSRPKHSRPKRSRPKRSRRTLQTMTLVRRNRTKTFR